MGTGLAAESREKMSNVIAAQDRNDMVGIMVAVGKYLEAY
jgi:hypothetical protein